jgi:Ankyrin repeat
MKTNASTTSLASWNHDHQKPRKASATAASGTLIPPLGFSSPLSMKRKQKMMVPGLLLTIGSSTSSSRLTPNHRNSSSNNSNNVNNKNAKLSLHMHRSSSLPGKMFSVTDKLNRKNSTMSSTQHNAHASSSTTKTTTTTTSMTSSTSSLFLRTTRVQLEQQVMSPQQTLEHIVQIDKGYPHVKVHSLDSIPSDFFNDLQPEEIEAYDLEVLQAIRESDLPKLRQYHAQGRPLKCSNRFGESLLHLACRKALLEVVDFLINEIQVPVCVKDDMGRTPLADAFWTINVNTHLVDILVSKCPDLLWIADRRGHTPLSYARREHWHQWNEYLRQKGNELDALIPKILSN